MNSSSLVGRSLPRESPEGEVLVAQLGGDDGKDTEEGLDPAGAEVSGFQKQRQSHQVERKKRHTHHVKPEPLEDWMPLRVENDWAKAEEAVDWSDEVGDEQNRDWGLD